VDRGLNVTKLAQWSAAGLLAVVAGLALSSDRTAAQTASGSQMDHPTTPAAFNGRIDLYKVEPGPFTHQFRLRIARHRPSSIKDSS